MAVSRKTRKPAANSAPKVLATEVQPPGPPLLSIAETHLSKISDSVLIVGSAPTVERYREVIRNFPGERWALNDAWFWLENNGIDVNAAFITDNRFLQKSRSKIGDACCQNIVVIDRVDLESIRNLKKTVYIFKTLGRDGFSPRYGEIYHGCSVFFTAVQTAFALKYPKIAVCGVLLPPPGRYVRVDGSRSMPEYVHAIQMKNARHIIRNLARFDVSLDVFEPESNLNFL